MGWREWLIRRLAKDVKYQLQPSRVIEDVKITVERGISGTWQVQVSAWDPDTSQAILWNVWNRLREDEE